MAVNSNNIMLVLLLKTMHSMVSKGLLLFGIGASEIIVMLDNIKVGIIIEEFQFTNLMKLRTIIIKMIENI